MKKPDKKGIITPLITIVEAHLGWSWPHPGTSVWTRYAVVAEEGLADVQSLLAFHASGSELIKVQQTNPTKCACSMNYVVLPSLKLTASLHLKNAGWKTKKSSWGPPFFRGCGYVSFREGKSWWLSSSIPNYDSILFFRGRRAVTVHFWGGKVYPTFLSKNERLGSEKAFPGAKSPCLISTSFWPLRRCMIGAMTRL